MIVAYINNNQAVKIAEIQDESEVDHERHHYQQIIDVTSYVQTPKVGWIWNGVNLITNIEDVTPRQMRQALILNGISMELIESSLDGLPEPMRSLAKVEWEYSIAFKRTNALVNQVGAALGWTPDQLDGLWSFAKSL